MDASTYELMGKYIDQGGDLSRFAPETLLKFKNFDETPKIDAPVTAGLQAFGNAATLGYLPEAQAAVGGLIPDPNKASDAALIDENPGMTIKPLDSGSQGGIDLPDARRRNIGLIQGNPKSSLAGGIAGAVSSAPIYGAGLGAVGLGGGGGLLAGAAKGSIGGGLLGAASNPNLLPSDSGLNGDKRLANAFPGAAIGTAFGALGGLLGGGAENAKQAAGEGAFGSLKPTPGQVSSSKPNIEDIGNTLIDEGIITGSKKTPQQIGEGIEQAANLRGNQLASAQQKIVEAGREMIENGTFDDGTLPDELTITKHGEIATKTKHIIDDIQEDLLPKVTASGSKEFKSAVSTVLDDFSSRYGKKINFYDMLKQRQALGSTIKWNLDPNLESPVQTVQKRLYAALNSALDNVSENVSEQLPGDAKEGYQQLRGIYSNLKDAGKIASKSADREFAAQARNSSDFKMGGMGALVGGLNHGIEGAVAGAAAGTATKALEKASTAFGQQPTAVYNSKLGNFLNSVPGADTASKAISSVPPGLLGMEPVEKRNLLNKNPSYLGGAIMNKYKQYMNSKPEDSK